MEAVVGVVVVGVVVAVVEIAVEEAAEIVVVVEIVEAETLPIRAAVKSYQRLPLCPPDRPNVRAYSKTQNQLRRLYAHPAVPQVKRRPAT
jgi:hypothetical protein